MKKAQTDYDVTIIGAGISGINFAYRLQTQTPELSFTILEGREAIGGTWDLFKYPGIRSDSDLYTFGFPWRPWLKEQSIADGPSILSYIKECASMYGIDKKIQFKHHVNAADWSSSKQAWSLSVNADGTARTIRTRFLLFCSGYYNYDEALPVEIPGIQNFTGKVVHPQFWPEDLEYENKNIVIIGSGATAITLLPALAKKASQVTMLQRSPSFILSQPTEDGLEIAIRKYCPQSLAHRLIRIKWLILPFLFVSFCRTFPSMARGLLKKATIAQLPPTLQHDPHFNPSYNPFEQRVCFCPDGDFYEALRSGTASVVTGIIDQVTPNSIKLQSGAELNPDIIVTATGLKIRLAGGVNVTLDNQPFPFTQKFLWKGVMMQDLPNTAFVIGYVDASWTLGADATAQLICRLLHQMEKENVLVATPRLTEDEEKGMKIMPLLRLSSTYVAKAKDVLPRCGDAKQWRARKAYLWDIWEAWYGDLRSGMQFTSRVEGK